MDHPNPQATHEAIKGALFAGNKIFAIHLYREQNHVSLAEAKAAVEKLEAELGITAVRNATVPPAVRYFVLLVILVLIVVIGALVWKLLASAHGHASP